MKVLIDDIIVNEKKRIRKSNGDIRTLAKSIEKYGLLQPVIVNSDLKLIAGYRRYLAVKSLGLDEIEVKIVNKKDKLSLMEIEMDENTARKDFSPEELRNAYKLRDRLSKPNFIVRFFRWLFSLFFKK